MELNNQLYIPEFGDKPPTLEGKRVRRIDALRGMKNNADKAFTDLKKGVKDSSNPDLTEEEALDVLKERAKRNPELRAKLKARGTL